MIIEYFDKHTEKPFWFKDHKYENVYVMEWILDEREHSFKEVIVIIVEWVTQTFGEFDDTRFDINFSDDGEDFSICFKNEQDAMLFKLNPPKFETVRFITQHDREKIYKEFGYDE